jgi:hypothetical protein
MEKICIECKLEKEIDLFVKNRNLCKECMKIYKKVYAQKNKEALKNKSVEYYNKNKDKIKERISNHYYNDKSLKLKYQKEYAEKNKERISYYKKEYTEKNREKILEYKRHYQNNRRKTDPVFRLKFICNRMIRNSLKCIGISKNQRTIDILGCDIQFFKNYIEEMFIDDMSWENYGKVWDIDHKIPLASATTEEEVLRLNHYTNLQPLDSYINRNVKRDKLDFSI